MKIGDKLDSIDNKLDKLISANSALQYSNEVLRLTLNDWLGQWIELYKIGQVKDSTLYKIRQIIRTYIFDTIGNIFLADIDGLTIQKFLMRINAPRQREHIFGLLKDAFRRAAVLQLIEYNPMQAVAVPKHVKKQSRAFDRAQERRFVSSCKKSKYSSLFLTMLYAGLRKGEAMALTERDIDFVNGYISVTKTVSIKRQITSPKTSAGIRQVPIFENLRPYLMYLQKKPYAAICTINAANVQNNFNKILKRANLYKQGFTIHSLRHTFATRCIEKNVPPKILQKWLGHSSLDMTLNVYTHVNSDFENSVIQNFNRGLKDTEIK